MTICATDVFAKTMTPEMITASEQRVQTLLQNYETLRQMSEVLNVPRRLSGKKGSEDNGK